ncbi:hypothetical protein SLA2020_333490 [Shorea laevis]
MEGYFRHSTFSLPNIDIFWFCLPPQQYRPPVFPSILTKPPAPRKSVSAKLQPLRTARLPAANDYVLPLVSPLVLRVLSLAMVQLTHNCTP